MSQASCDYPGSQGAIQAHLMTGDEMQFVLIELTWILQCLPSCPVAESSPRFSGSAGGPTTAPGACMASSATDWQDPRNVTGSEAALMLIASHNYLRKRTKLVSQLLSTSPVLCKADTLF